MFIHVYLEKNQLMTYQDVQYRIGLRIGMKEKRVSFLYMNKEYNRAVAVGIGEHYERNKDLLFHRIEVSMFADSNTSKQNQIIDGIRCIHLSDIKKNDFDFAVILPHKMEIKKQLTDMILELNIDYCYLDDLIFEALDQEKKEFTIDCKKRVQSIFKESNVYGNRLILLNTPQVTSTIGDHAITYSEIELLKKWFPRKKLVEIGDRDFWTLKDEIYSYILPSDTLLIQGGGYLGSLWQSHREDTVRYILQKYKSNRIIILPQTMYFESDVNGMQQLSISKSIYNSHANLIVCFREQKSFELSQEVLKPYVKRYLIPDTVMSLKYDGKKEIKSKIAICIKNDKETILSSTDQSNLLNMINEMGFEACYTTMFYDGEIIDTIEREKLIKSKMKEFASYRVLITDAMHGMVLAAVCGTSCVAIESITGKVGGVYQWLKQLSYVKYAESLEEVEIALREVINQEDNYYDHSHLDRYYEQLKDIIDYF